MQSRLCAAYGLTCVADFDWAWCPAASNEREADLLLSLSGLGSFDARASTDDRIHAQRFSKGAAEPAVLVVHQGGEGHFRISFRDGAQFVINGALTEIFGTSDDRLTHDDLMVYLQGPILGFLLRLRGVTCLHASAAVVDGRAFAVVGNGGMGKSTSAASFAKLGLPILTDDVLALRDNGSSFDVQPGLPRVLLWPESVAALFGHADALPRLVSTWDKRYLDLAQPGFQFAQQPTPLGAVYVLGERLSAAATPEITSVQGTQALMTLVANTYANDLLDAKLRACELDALSRVIRHVPVRLVRAPNDRAMVPRVCEAIIADLRRLA